MPPTAFVWAVGACCYRWIPPHVPQPSFACFPEVPPTGLDARNVATLVDLPRQTRREMHALSQEEAARFLSAAQDDRWGVLFAFAVATGMRPEEYLALT